MKLFIRATIVLTAYDYESLQITLISLTHTTNPSEKIVIILNGKNGNYNAARVERVAREWANIQPANRFVVRPLCAGAKAFFAIKEVLEQYAPLKGVKYICKIDDDIIPLRRGWIDNLESNYLRLSATSSIGFTTGLINNNCWGFNELLDIFKQRTAFEQKFNYFSNGGSQKIVAPGKVDSGVFGTIWQYPYIAWWQHQWTTLDIDNFLKKTKSLPVLQIPPETNYSIGCIFFEKDFWLKLDHHKYSSVIDEQIIQFTCLDESKSKWAMMNEPIIHLFYFNQRVANRDIISPVLNALSAHFKDESFKQIDRMSAESLVIDLENKITSIENTLSTFFLSIAPEAE